MSGGSRVAGWLVTAALAAGAWWGWQHLPDRHNPLAPLAFEDAPNWLTRYKLDRLDAGACQALLATTPFQFTPLDDRDTDSGCVLRNTVRVDRTALQIGSAVTLSCRAAVSLALWEQHIVKPAAQREFGRPVQRLDHFGSLSCRNVYGRAEGRRSQHASADAIDVAGFVLQGGRRTTVARNWTGDSAEARFLREIRTGACTFFDGVFSPDYNAAHADHLHLDRGPYRLCR